MSCNEDRFDFPLLKADLEKFGKNLECDILCADSYIAIKNIVKSRYDVSSRMSFSLINLHQKFCGYLPEMCHGAEADCLTLLKVTTVLGPQFFDWVEDNCYKFNHCNVMWNII